MNYYLPPVIVVFGLVLFQVSQKSVNENANPFVVIAAAYSVGIFACIVGYFLIPRQNTELLPVLKSIGWSSIGIGIGAVTCEIGILLAYRTGWNISILPISTNVFSALILILIGIFAYRESLSFEKIIGVLMCVGGLVLITLRK
jgi:drug/metabolite transporter (DMT)-like permease